MAENTVLELNKKNTLSRLLGSLNAQRDDIQQLFSELQQVKHEVEEILSDPSPDSKMLERLSELEKQFSPDERYPGGGLDKKLEKFVLAAKKVDEEFHRVVGRKVTPTPSNINKKIKKVQFV